MRAPCSLLHPNSGRGPREEERVPTQPPARGCAGITGKVAQRFEFRPQRNMEAKNAWETKWVRAGGVGVWGGVCGGDAAGTGWSPPAVMPPCRFPGAALDEHLVMSYNMTELL